MRLNLSDIAEKPHEFSHLLTLPGGEEVMLRPLIPSDVQKLASFFEHLSPETRRFSTYPGYDLPTAEVFCDAIGRYDKLRFVVEIVHEKTVIGLLEFSFSIPEGDHERYKRYSIELNEANDCRLGPCLSDGYQGKGIGSIVFPYIVDIAKRFGRTRIILWGGVLSDNKRAIRYYEKHGFQFAGKFIDRDGIEGLDMFLML